MSVRHRLVVLATALGTAAALLAGSTTGAAWTSGSFPRPGGTASTVSPATTGQTVDVFVRRDHTVVMPDSIAAGVTRFRISSRRVAGFQLAQPAAGYTKAEASGDIDAAFNGNNMRALRRFEANMTLLGGMPSGRLRSAAMTADLVPGTYWALDTVVAVPRPAKISSFEVSGDDVGGRLTGNIIRATGEHEWGKLSPRIPRRGTIRFQNRSDVPHFIVVAKLRRGATMRDFNAWIEEARAGGQSEPPVNPRVTLDTGVLSGGQEMAFRYSLPPGRYVLTCFWPDSDMRGTPHAFLGMNRGIRVG